MIATYRFQDSENKTIGFYVDGNFYNLYYVKRNINHIDNLRFARDGSFHEKKELRKLSYRDTIMHKKYNTLVKENPFRRDIQKDFLKWKKTSNHILRLDGARRCGKTTELLKFAYKNYTQVIYINLAHDSLFPKLYQYPVKEDVMRKYCRLKNLPEYTNSKETILIIDEIQENSKIYNALEEFHSDLKCDIAVSGSYLGRVLMNQEFFVIAHMDCYTMFPLSFAEFCRVFHKESLLKKISLSGKSEDQSYKVLDELYQIYIQIGGYPDVVKEYCSSQSIEKSLLVVGNIIRIVSEESAVYIKRERDIKIFEQVYKAAIMDMISNKRGTGNKTTDQIVNYITKSNQKFLVNRDEVLNAVAWLSYCKLLDFVSLALEGDISRSISGRRMYFMDCGIFHYLAVSNHIDHTNFTGLQAETFVFNELNRLLFRYSEEDIVLHGREICFSVCGNYELDFMVVDKTDTVYGIEVKSHAGSHKSLNVFLEKHLIDQGVIANFSKGGKSEQYITIPIYTVGCRFPYH